MAIDKGLFQAPKKPTRSKLNVPAPQDAEALRVPLAEKPPIEVKPTEDGGAEIDFDPQAMAIEMGESQGNLAEVLEEDVGFLPEGFESMGLPMSFGSSK